MLDRPSSSGSTDPASPARPLSPREIEVIQMAVRGMSNPAIAHELNITVHAIKFHMASIYRKLGVANRTEAAVAFLNSLEPRA